MMHVLPPLVVPVDLSGLSARLVHYARHLGGGPLHLLHVPSDEATPAQVDETQAALMRLLGPWAGDAARITLVMRPGEEVAETIVAYTREVGAACVVMGRPARRGIRTWLLGREADVVVRTAPCPVLVMPAGALAPRHLLVAVDLQAAPGALLRAARAFRDTFAPDARLTALYVVPPLPYPDAWLGQITFSLMPDLHAQARQDLQRVVDDALGRDAGVETVVDLGMVAPSILNTATERDADLVVVAPHNHPAVDRVLLGSVAERVVRLADRPVLVLRGTALPAA